MFLPIPQRTLTPSDMHRSDIEDYPINFTHKSLTLSSADIKEIINNTGANFLHLSSSACLNGMTDSRLPDDKKGCLLPFGALLKYDIIPSSGEGGGDTSSLKYHAVSVCSTVDINGSLGDLAKYSNTPGFIMPCDYPVIFAILNNGDMTADFADNSFQIIDPPEKMDASEFAIRGGIDAKDIKAIIVPKEFYFNARERLETLSFMMEKIVAL
jgi:hypothetical protein